jgi:hypothetical protein
MQYMAMRKQFNKNVNKTVRKSIMFYDRNEIYEKIQQLSLTERIDKLKTLAKMLNTNTNTMYNRLEANDYKRMVRSYEKSILDFEIDCLLILKDVFENFINNITTEAQQAEEMLLTLENNEYKMDWYYKKEIKNFLKITKSLINFMQILLKSTEIALNNQNQFNQ